MNLRIRNSELPWYTGPEVKFNMLPFIMFDSKLGLGHGNNPVIKLLKREGKKEDLFLWYKSKKGEGS